MNIIITSILFSLLLSCSKVAGLGPKADLKIDRAIGSEVGGTVNNNPTPTPTPIMSATPNPTPTLPSGGGGNPDLNPNNCSPDPAVICNGGYDADPGVKKQGQMRVVFLPMANSSFNFGVKATTAASIVNKMNPYYVYNGHTHIKFDSSNIALVDGISPSIGNVQSPSYMAQNFGSTDGKFSFILVEGYCARTRVGNGCLLGYSSFLRIPSGSNFSFVVMDADYIINQSIGAVVAAHEFGHMIGFQHTTNANGGGAGNYPTGVFPYKNLQLRSYEGLYDFSAFVYGGDKDFKGDTTISNVLYTTKTLMFYSALPFELFVDGKLGSNAMNSKIIDTFYNTFIKH
jgi:hypothetical protein